MYSMKVVQLVSVCCILFGQASAQQTGASLTLTIDTRKTYQTIDNFGASDAWAAQFVGNWPEAKRNEMADWLFSMDTTANGQPKGIGLSMWRFNLGAGSTQQGDASGIRDEWRRAESFLEADGSYNWNRQAAQQWFLKAAQQRGVKSFLAFYNSPPVTFTKNGKAFSGVKGVSNIDPSKYEALADYSVKAIKGIQQKTGMRFDYLSPVNEPQWDWSDGGQEGCPYTNEEVGALVKVLSSRMKQAGLSTRLLIAEAGHLKYLLKDNDKPGKGNQLADLFAPTGKHYIGKQPLVAPVIAGHSYFSTSPYANGVALRRELAAKVAAIKGLSFWQSEYCILGDNDGEIGGDRKDTGMRAALYVARTIHTDLAEANAAAWQWWLSISPYNYKDGLIYIDHNKTDGAYSDSKILWALGNYSRFVRPGMQRVDVSLGGARANIYASAYGQLKSGKLVVVIVNTGKDPYPVSLQLAGGKKARSLQNITSYTTSATQKLAPAKVQGAVTIGGESIVTLVIDQKL